MSHSINLDEVLTISRNELDCKISKVHIDELNSFLDTQHDHSIPKVELKEKLDTWFQKMKLKNKRINFFNLEIKQSPFSAVRLIVHDLFEERQLSRIELPYLNQHQDTDEPTESLWTSPVSTEFCNDKQVWRRSGSGKVVNCEYCYKTGEIKCTDCKGLGYKEKMCMNCLGSGKIEAKDVSVGVSTTGPNSGVTMKQVQCMHCRASGKSQKTCTNCMGKGDLECPNCRGSKELFIYDEITAKSQLKEKNQAISPIAGLREKWIKKSKPYQRLTEDYIFDTPISVNANTVRVGQRYEVSLYKVTKASFFLKKEREIFIIGDSIFPVNANFLRSRWKLIGLVIIITLAIGALVVIWAINK